MHKKTITASNSLFLMELILISLFLAISCSACIRLFSLTWDNQREAQRLQHTRELTVQIGEFLEGWDGDPQAFSQTFSAAADIENIYWFYFDKNWNSASEDSAVFTLAVDLEVTDTARQAELTFSENERELSSQTIRFPRLSGKEASHAAS